MLLEYKIKLTKHGLTISQYVSQTAAAPPPMAQANSLQATFAQSKAAAAANLLASKGVETHSGSGPSDDGPRGTGPSSDGPRGTGGLSGSAPMTIIGPIFFGCLPRSADEHDDSETKD